MSCMVWQRIPVSLKCMVNEPQTQQFKAPVLPLYHGERYNLNVSYATRGHQKKQSKTNKFMPGFSYDSVSIELKSLYS